MSQTKRRLKPLALGVASDLIFARRGTRQAMSRRGQTRTGRIGLAVALLSFLLLHTAAWGQIDDAQYRRDFQALTAFPSRTIGSDGYYKAAKYLQQQISALPNVELRVHEYPVMVPQTGSATLELDDHGTMAVYPFWPAQVRLNTTPPEGISGNLVYAGRARYADLRPQDLQGQIAVVEASADEYWSQVAYCGARAILILGSDDVNNNDLQYQDLMVPVNVPRFYVPPGPLADALRPADAKPGIVGHGTLKATGNWTRVTARNLYALVRPSQPIPQGWTMPRPPAALMFSVRYESSSLVPDLAPGASQAVQAAAGLALLRDLSRQPLDRPVIVFFGGADAIQFLGTRNMLMALADPPSMWLEQVEQIDQNLNDLQRDLGQLRAAEPNPQKIDLRRSRSMVERIAKIIETDATLDLDELFRLRMKRPEELTDAERARRDELEPRQVALSDMRFAFARNPSLLRQEDLDVARQYVRRTIDQVQTLIGQDQARRQELQDRVDLYRWLAGRLGRSSDPGGSDNADWLIELIIGLDLSDHGVRVGPVTQGRFQDSPAISNVLDYRDWFTRRDREAQENQPGAAWYTALTNVIDFEPLSGARSALTSMGASMPIPTEMADAWGIAGMSMVTLDDLRLRSDTPADTPQRMDLGVILPQLHAVRDLYWHAWNDVRFVRKISLKWRRKSWEGQVVSPAPGRPVPDLPRPGFLATYYYTAGNTVPTRTIKPRVTIPWTLGIRRDEVQDCDAEGRYRFEGVPHLNEDALAVLAVQVYRIHADDGRITAASDLGQQSGDIKTSVDLREELTPIRSLVFGCQEFSLVGLYDPRFLQDLSELTILDARRNADPQRVDIVIGKQMMAGFVEPDTAVALGFRYGRIGNRLLLINMPDVKDQKPATYLGKDVQDLARGFRVAALRDIGPLSLQTAEDFWRIDEVRLENYRRAGVQSRLLDDLHHESAEQIERARQAVQQNDGADLVKNANGAWANEARVYQAAQDMARDVVRAAIFLLLLCVPFAFCMERLLIGTANIYKQIAYAMGFFAVMTAALWSFHPAFKISTSPLIIILAFAIIFMSLVVISVVYARFDSELKKIRSGRGTAASTSFARASVLSSAVLLGIANMRKRKFRTALTSITVVLITFAVLCFTSATHYLDITTLPTGLPTPYAGIMLRQRGFRPMPGPFVENLRVVLANRYSFRYDATDAAGRPEQGVVHADSERSARDQIERQGLTIQRMVSVPPPHRQIVQRWWNINAAQPTDQVEIVSMPSASASGSAPIALASNSAAASLNAAATPRSPSRIGSVKPRVYAVQALLGLTPGESALSAQGTIGSAPIAQVVPHFDRLENGQQRIIYISQPIADELKVHEGDDVQVGGMDLQVAGIYDANAFDQRVVSLSGEPLSPLKYTSGALDSGGRKLQENNADDLDLDAGAAKGEMASTYEHLPSTQFAIVPAAISQLLPNASLRSIGLRLEDEADVKQVTNTLARRFAVAMFAGFADGVKMVAANNSLQGISGASQVAIPLAIAGLIIFNTMMGSIAERRREIHVYTSLGLAPLHVGALFVAEAMTYGLIGAVFGYVIGQGAGTLMLKLGWLGSATLNYSGTSAMLTLSLILLIVLLSALVPARLASKIAAPSIDRTWRVPLPKGDEIIAQLPFTINKTAADGALAYLAEFFDAHQEGSIGKFSAGKVEVFDFADEQGRTSRGLKTVVWLTPFDLGVRQHLILLVHPGQYEDIYEVQVVLQRLSGDDGSWYRMNRSFLTELRKQFLQWRSLTPQRMLAYIDQSKRLFGGATTVPANASA